MKEQKLHPCIDYQRHKQCSSRSLPESKYQSHMGRAVLLSGDIYIQPDKPYKSVPDKTEVNGEGGFNLFKIVLVTNRAIKKLLGYQSTSSRFNTSCDRYPLFIVRLALSRE